MPKKKGLTFFDRNKRKRKGATNGEVELKLAGKYRLDLSCVGEMGSLKRVVWVWGFGDVLHKQLIGHNAPPDDSFKRS